MPRRGREHESFHCSAKKDSLALAHEMIRRGMVEQLSDFWEIGVQAKCSESPIMQAQAVFNDQRLADQHTKDFVAKYGMKPEAVMEKEREAEDHALDHDEAELQKWIVVAEEHYKLLKYPKAGLEAITKKANLKKMTKEQFLERLKRHGQEKKYDSERWC